MAKKTSKTGGRAGSAKRAPVKKTTPGGSPGSSAGGSARTKGGATNERATSRATGAKKTGRSSSRAGERTPVTVRPPRRPRPRLDEAALRKQLEAGARRVRERDVEAVVERREEVEAKLEEAPGRLRRMVNQGRLLVEMISDYWHGTYRDMPWWVISVAVVAITYLLMPVDAIPDSLPGVGLLDDALVIGLAVMAVEEELHEYCAFKAYDPSQYFG